MSTETAVAVKNVSKSFRLPHQRASSFKELIVNPLSILGGNHNNAEIQWALKSIDFEVKKGEFFGIVGRNGSGKSTLLKILAGIYQPTKGTVKTHGKLVPFIELGVGFNGELTGRENVYMNGALLGFSRKEIEKKYNDIVDFAEIERFMDQKLKNYSSGMQVRLAFSVATKLAESDILLIDEVLAVGDADFQRKCFTYFKSIKKQGKTVVFVSHDMGAIREYCDRAILIDKSEIVALGSSDQVATKYSRLFLDKSNKQTTNSVETIKRWGDKNVTHDKVIIKLDDNKIKITDVIKSAVSYTDLVVGFRLRSSAGTVILGTNTKITNKKVFSMKKDTIKKIVWCFDNILSDGEYVVDVAIERDGGVAVCDWWEDAATVVVAKESRSPYLIDPEISLSFISQ
jgi:ABC-2 type transport system ATP-binding protein